MPCQMDEVHACRIAAGRRLCNDRNWEPTEDGRGEYGVLRVRG